MSHVRTALQCDFDDLFRLLLTFHTENPIAPLSIKRVADHLYDMIENDHVFCALDERGAIVGGLGFAESPLWLSERVDLYDMFFFVYEEHRGQGHGDALADAYVDYAIECGRVAFLTVMNDYRARGRIAAIHVFDPIGYRVRLTTGDEPYVPVRRQERDEFDLELQE